MPLAINFLNFDVRKDKVDKGVFRARGTVSWPIFTSSAAARWSSGRSGDGPGEHELRSAP